MVVSKKVHTFALAIGKSTDAKRIDSLAQQVEHNTFNVGVLGSSPKRITQTKSKTMKRGCLKIELRWPLLFHLQLKSFGFSSKKKLTNLLLKISFFQTVYFVAISSLRGCFCKIMCNGQQAELNFNLLKPTKMEPLEVLVVLEVSKYGFHILRSLTAIFQTFIREQLFTFPFLDFPQTVVYLYNPFRPASVTPAS